MSRVVADNINYYILKYQSERTFYIKASWLKKAIASLAAAIERDGPGHGAIIGKKAALDELSELAQSVEDVMRRAKEAGAVDPELFIELDNYADRFLTVFIKAAFDVVALTDTIEEFMKTFNGSSGAMPRV